jgi:hypothetical protein
LKKVTQRNSNFSSFRNSLKRKREKARAREAERQIDKKKKIETVKGKICTKRKVGTRTFHLQR